MHTDNVMDNAMSSEIFKSSGNIDFLRFNHALLLQKVLQKLEVYSDSSCSSNNNNKGPYTKYIQSEYFEELKCTHNNFY